MHTLITRFARLYGPLLCCAVLLVVLNSCSDTTVKSAPPVWARYKGDAFTMSYFTSWSAATKDFYLGTHYPQLEMLQGELFSSGGGGTTFLQVAYAAQTKSKASAQDIMLTFLLNTSGHPAAASSLSSTTLAQETWYQGSVEKQVKQSNGSMLSVKETVLGMNRKVGTDSTGVYLIFYQDSTNTYAQNAHDFFERMVNSFQFAP